MAVGEICNREVVVVDKGDDAREAARLMREYHVGDLVVVERGDEVNIPLGIVTDRDLVIEVLARGVEPETVIIQDLLVGELVTAEENEEMLECLTRMREKGIRRLPVVTEAGVLAGILTLDDILELLSEELSDLVALIDRQPLRERKQHP